MGSEKFVLLPAPLKHTYKNITKLSSTGRVKKKTKKPPKGFDIAPTFASQSELDKQIQSILKQKNILDYQKWKLLSQLSSRAIREAQREAVAAAVAEGASVGQQQHGRLLKRKAAIPSVISRKSNRDVLEEALGFTEGKKKISAQRIIDFISGDNIDKKQFTWDSLGRIVVNGTLLHNSNIAELIADVLRPNKSVITSVVGDKQFKAFLHANKIPIELVHFKKKYYTPAEYNLFRHAEAKLAEKATGVKAKKTRSGELYGTGKKRHAAKKWFRVKK